MNIPCRILLVCRTQTAAELQPRLERLGWAVAGVAVNAPECLALARQHHPEVVLLEVASVGLATACDLARQLHRESHLPSVLAMAEGVTPPPPSRPGNPWLCISQPWEDREIKLVLAWALNQNQAEEELKQAKARFHQLIETTHDWIWEIDDQAVYTYCSPQVRGILGYEPEEMVGRSVFDFMPPSEAQRVRHLFTKLGERRQPFRGLENLNRRKDGQLVVLSTNAIPLFDAQGQYCGYRGMDRDLTSSKNLESKIVESEQRFKSLLNNLSDPAWLTDTDGRFLAVNDAWCDVFGLNPVLVIGSRSADMLPPELSSRFLAEDQEILRTGQPLRQEEMVVRADGRTTWYETVKSAVRDELGNPIGITGLARDITQRRLVEQALRDSEHKYRELVENANSIILHWAADGKIRFMNEFGLRFFGYTEAEIMGRHVLETIVPGVESSGRSLQALMASLCANPGQFESSINENVRRNGERVWIAWTNKVVLDAQGRVQEILSIGSDITERRRATEELLRSRERLDLALKSANMGVFEWNLITHQRSWDENMHRLIGLSPDGFSGQFAEYLEHVHPEDRQRVNETLAQAIRQQAAYELEYRAGGPGDDWRHVAERGQVICDAAGKAQRLIGVCWDITGTKRLQDQLRQAQKMEAVGQLAGGLAHDFNNILTGILMNTYLLQKSAPLVGEAADLVNEMETAARRAANLTRQLLLYGRRQAMQRKVVDLSLVIGNVLQMLRRLLGENIGLAFLPAEPAVCVFADDGMLEQVVTNLCLNARDAMPHGGRIQIDIHEAEISASVAQTMNEARPGRFARLSVTDTGSGMDEQSLKHLFEPFYTTKEVGKGTGLGLATVYGIVQQHNGWIRVKSAVGQGTTFDVFLPRHECEVPAPVPAVAISTQMATSQGETILMVEDEMLVRITAAKYLRQHGYRILEAGTGAEALALWQAHRADLQLLFTDVMMPEGMSGLELAKRILQDAPGLKVLIGTGYSEEIVRQGIPNRPGVQFMTKPYDPEVLLATIRQLLAPPQKNNR